MVYDPHTEEEDQDAGILAAEEEGLAARLGHQCLRDLHDHAAVQRLVKRLSRKGRGPRHRRYFVARDENWEAHDVKQYSMKPVMEGGLGAQAYDLTREMEVRFDDTHEGDESTHTDQQ
eukprot:6099560-Pyramimonas_sp.AAC.1